MPNYTKKRHRTSRKKIGGAHHQRAYTDWIGRPGNTYAADMERFQLPRQPHLNPQSSIVDNLKRYLRNVTRHYRDYGTKISDSRFINAVRSVLRRTPPPATIVETIVETPLPPPPGRPSNNTASTASTKLSKTRIKPSIAKQTKRRSRISQILRRSQRSKP